MDSSIPRCILLIVLIVVGGFFSGAETAFSYCNKIRMKTLADDGDKSAIRVVKIVENFDKMLVTVLILINILHVAASSMATVIAISFIPWNPSVATLISTVLLTLIVFFVSETIPKSIAKENCDAFARYSSIFIYWLVVILSPVSFIFTSLGNLCKKLISSDKSPSITGEELSDIVEIVEDEGVLTDGESEIIRSAIDFSEMTVEDIYTPLENAEIIEKNTKPEDIKKILLATRFSRIPVYDHDTSHIIGILQTKSYLASEMKCSGDEYPELKEHLKPVYYVRPSAKLDTVFEKMVKRRSHFAIVTNSHGGMIGLVTMEDILEEIVGEIYDEDDLIPEKNGGDK